MLKTAKSYLISANDSKIFLFCVCFAIRLLSVSDLNFCTNFKPCRNNGTCHNTGVGAYRCTCRPGFTGTGCEHIVDDGCTYVDCLNGGSCIVSHHHADSYQDFTRADPKTWNIFGFLKIRQIRYGVSVRVGVVSIVSIINILSGSRLLWIYQKCEMDSEGLCWCPTLQGMRLRN